MKVLRTAFLLTALTLVLIVVGDAFGGPNGMKIALGFAALLNAIAYFFSDKIALMSSGAKPVSREQLPRLYEVMERLAAKANLPVPKLYLVPEAAPNAFATGRNPRHASVAVTQGLLQLMNDDELEGVIAHELSHVRNYDILISSIAATLAGAITYAAKMGYWASIFGYGGGRDNERQGGAQMVGQQFGLISALQKLGAYNQRIPSNIPQTTSALCIVKPMFGAGSVWSSLFSTHPPLEDRIAALREMTISRPG